MNGIEIGKAYIKMTADISEYLSKLSELSEKTRSAMAGSAQSTESLNRASKTVGQSLSSVGAIGSTAGLKIKTSFAAALRSAVSLERTLNRLAFMFTVGAVFKAVSAIKDMIKGSIKDAIKLESAMARVFTLSSSMANGMETALTLGVERAAARFGIPAEKMAAALYDIRSASIPAAKSLKVLDVAAKAAVGGGIKDVKKAAKPIVSILNAYNLSAEHAMEVSDKLFYLVNKGILNYDELSDAMSKVTSNAALVGVGLDTVVGSMAVMTRAGIDARGAATALARLFDSFIRPTEKAREAAKGLGIELSSVYFKTVGLVGIVRKLQEATPEQIAAIAGRARAFRALAAAVQNTAGLYRDISGAAKDSAGTTTRAYKRMMDTTEKILERFKEAWKRMIRSSITESRFFKDLLLTYAKIFDNIAERIGTPEFKKLKKTISGTTYGKQLAEGIIGEDWLSRLKKGEIGVKELAKWITTLQVLIDKFDAGDPSMMMEIFKVSVPEQPKFWSGELGKWVGESAENVANDLAIIRGALEEFSGITTTDLLGNVVQQAASHRPVVRRAFPLSISPQTTAGKPTDPLLTPVEVGVKPEGEKDRGFGIDKTISEFNKAEGEIVDRIKGVSDILSSSITSAFTAINEGSKSAAKAFKDIWISAIMAVVAKIIANMAIFTLAQIFLPGIGGKMKNPFLSALTGESMFPKPPVPGAVNALPTNGIGGLNPEAMAGDLMYNFSPGKGNSVIPSKSASLNDVCERLDGLLQKPIAETTVLDDVSISRLSESGTLRRNSRW